MCVCVGGWVNVGGGGGGVVSFLYGNIYVWNKLIFMGYNFVIGVALNWKYKVVYGMFFFLKKVCIVIKELDGLEGLF